MKEIALANDSRVALVDDGDYELVTPYRWYVNNGGVRSVTKYAVAYPAPGVALLMHRLVMSPPDGMRIDHVDGDGLNNTRTNLRLCTHTENMWNKAKRAAATSQYKGVYFDAARGLWRAALVYNKRRIHLGRYANERDAASAYDAKARELFGDFARPNFV